MGIAMRHPDIADPIEAVDEAQAVYLEAKNWYRLDADQVEADRLAAAVVQDSMIRGPAESAAEAVEALEEIAAAREAADLEALTNDELHALAAEHGVEVPARATKAELIAAIQAGTSEEY